MSYYLDYVFPYFVEYRYLAIFFALTAAGFGVPLPEELTVVLSGYLTAINHLNLGLALIVCYLGVLTGDVVTYCLGRFGASYFLETRYARWIISRKKLEQVQYYYRGYGPYYLLAARQLPGLRFPSFFSAGMVKMNFFKFLAFDALGAMVSMPIIFTVAYYFGPRLEQAISLVLKIRDIGFFLGIASVGMMTLLAILYFCFYKKSNPVKP